MPTFLFALFISFVPSADTYNDIAGYYTHHQPYPLTDSLDFFNTNAEKPKSLTITTLVMLLKKLSWLHTYLLVQSVSL